MAIRKSSPWALFIYTSVLMPIITADEFKLLMRRSGTVSNVEVKEEIVYNIADPVNMPRSMTIINCKLKSFQVSRNHIDSLTFNDGSIGELRIHKDSDILELTIDKTDISSIELVETQIGRFNLSPGQSQKAALTGGMASIKETVITGNLQMIRLNRIQGDLLSVANCELQIFNLYNISVTNVSLNNVSCPTEILLDYEGWRPDRLNVTNVKADLKFKIERTKEISLAKPVKLFDFNILRSQFTAGY